MIWLRSTLYLLGWAVNTVLCAIACMLALPLPYRFRYGLVRYWARFALKWLEITCGLKSKVIGLEHLPSDAAVVMSKHQSAFETLALLKLLPFTAWVIKRELLWIPFFGWGIWSVRPIAIDRSNRAAAARQLISQGGERLKQGSWIVIFPEGTRISAGQRGNYKSGGARVACALSAPVVPVAVNSGEFWPRNSFLKYPGVTTISFGPAIATAGRKPEEVSREVEAWIEGEMVRISGVGPCWPRNKKPEQVHGPLAA
ncbi:1-acyl-sn-glycerol-3-phosphate acyltransferase [Chitinimonas arctica]|uniref:1-acyl-sn-glycerol-3-phosphate acyltransferase n=1 Tax=Chitinimonas arctica TaxID=2594795 RepID=A0A516SEP4_9NEIS|nr:lysophospholipid acyltransferase family protein [Chitinimonas arctica]QDQ26639.1 1-acyl-sn-glycerol-3-phosphate acyltransferase [Chitinimonas arctica]